MNTKKSIIWNETRGDFQNRVNNCNSIADIIRSFGFATNRAQYSIVYRRIKSDNIDISHIPLGKNSKKNRSFVGKPIENYLKKGVAVQGQFLKKKLIQFGLMEEVCQQCGLGNVWNSAPLALQLDHINGIRDDTRIENIRLLCPNCHSQTSTFSGRNNILLRCCLDCKTRISSSKCQRCRSCANKKLDKNRKMKFLITEDELEKLIWEKPTTQIAKDFNVSDKAIEKRCKKFGINKPPRGYWRKTNALV